MRNRSTREQQQQAIVYGVRESARALASGLKLSNVCGVAITFAATGAQQVVHQLGEAGAQTLELSADAFDKLAYGDRLDGVVSIFTTPSRTIADISLPRNTFGSRDRRGRKAR